MRAFALAIAFVCVSAACSPATGSDNPYADNCASDAQCFNGQRCEMSRCVPVDTAEVRDAGNMTLDAGDAADAGMPPTAADAGLPSPDGIQLTILSPLDRSSAYVDETLELSGQVSATDGDITGFEVRFHSSIDGAIETTFDALTGTASASLRLSEGNHRLSLIAIRNGMENETAIDITVCGYLVAEDFSDPLNPANWVILGDAQRMEDGWLEMTNNQPFRFGQIYLSSQTISPGSLDAAFRIYTGPQDATGSDGFTLNIIDAQSQSELEAILSCAGGIGNTIRDTVAGCQLSEGELESLRSFSIEFDTFPNGFACGHEINGPTDPSCEDHVAITMNGSAMPFYWLPEGWGDEQACQTPNPSGSGIDWIDEDGCRAGLDCVDEVCKSSFIQYDRTFLGYGVPDADTPRFWAPLSNIEDSQWHDVEVTLEPGRAIVRFDGETVIDSTVPTFDFKGGFLGFAGGSGAGRNYHRFDDIRIKSGCAFQAP